jgi:nucleoside-diphosphate-sugar epimerase
VLNDDLRRHYDSVTVVLTGGYGYIGAALAAALRETSARVVLVSRAERPPVPGTETLTADVRTNTCWTQILGRADIIFHLAGNTSARRAAHDEAASLESTVRPVTLLAAAARASQRAPRVVYASTATVYGVTDRIPVSEDTEPKPATTYDFHKLCAERELERASRQGVLDGMSLRLPNVYGPSSGANAAPERGVLNRVAGLALEGADVPLYGGGRYLRDYVYIDDVVRAFLMAGVREEMSGGSVNVGSGIGTAVRDAFHLVVERAERLTGRRARLLDAPWPSETDPIASRNFVADIRRVASWCGWRPEVSLSDGIDRLLASFNGVGSHFSRTLPEGR